MTHPRSQKAIALLDGLEESSDACKSWDFTTIRQALLKLQELETDAVTRAGMIRQFTMEGR